MSKSKKRILVTGGAGFVGTNLIKFFLKKTNFYIISLDNYSSGNKKNHIKSKLYYYRASGFLNALLNKRSWFRPRFD